MAPVEHRRRRGRALPRQARLHQDRRRRPEGRVLRRARLLIAAALAAILAAALWWRRNPSACPYSQRFWVEAPHPLITRERLRDVLSPRSGETILELGTGTGYYSLDLATWVAPEGRIELFDIQQEMLDHVMRRADERGIANLTATRGDAASLPYPDSSIDAVVLTTVLGEITDQPSAMAEITRVLRPGGRLIVGELFGDPHFTTPAKIERLGAEAGLVFESRSGPWVGSFSRLVKPR
ncbi:MAG TPA: methyltransferase domain-containing protein [Solirubrobacterales bacterium]|nr:methyltransferase domain-containing protein [Solirubrobacterales bacterium]